MKDRKDQDLKMKCLHPFERRLADTIKRHQLIGEGRQCLVGLSGGADSVALLLGLWRLGYRLHAAHCNFRLRGAESDRDEHFCIELCQSLDIPLSLTHFDTISYAELHRVSIEMAARELRYAYFMQLSDALDRSVIAVAHHADDRAETLFINLLRGTGLNGLVSMTYQSERLIRPLLDEHRSEIIDYLAWLGQDHIEDSSNAVADVVRNRIRLQVLPLMRDISPGADKAIDRTLANIADARMALHEWKETVLNEIMGTYDSHFFSCATIDIEGLSRHAAPSILIHEALCGLGFSGIQIREIVASLEVEDKRVGKQWFSSTHRVLVDRKKIMIGPKPEPFYPLDIPLTGLYNVADIGKLRIGHVPFRSEDPLSGITMPHHSSFNAFVDADRISFPLHVRNVQTGDQFCPIGMQGRVLVSDFLTNLKLSRWEKEAQPILTDARGQIVWVIGRRIADPFRVIPTCRRMLRLEWIPSREKNHE